MNGKILDCAVVAAVVVTFFAFAIFHPGVGNLLVGWLGAVALGYYSVYVRHDPELVNATRGGERALDHSTTLRPAWR
ncbi:MAG: hypothetical protein JWN03_464 [Nocardia sp.]|uniref:hypothetical protein n=1 Tax=Nocardia sp. TaxID=1821 RepID=UPI0026315F1C|nr:hypothetical protein [Nocardia sp.]MCU1640189.1 hypothetical protein [Nocardia sp.]